MSAFDDGPVTIYETELEGLSGDTNVSLQATNDIRVEDLTDNRLMFAVGDGSIEFVADADMDGAGSFVMEDTVLDTIATNGRDLTISGASLSLSTIDTSRGANDGGDVVLEAIGKIDSAGITTKSIASFDTSSDSGSGGNISISSISGNIVTYGQVDSSSTSYRGNSGRGGDIVVTSNSGDITANNSVLSFSSSVSGDSSRGGDIIVSSNSGDITANNSVLSFSSSVSGDSSRGGDIVVSSNSGDIIANNSVSAFSSSASGDSGRRGSIRISSSFTDTVALTELRDNLVETTDLLAHSCFVRTDKPQGRFIITGSDSLRARPGYPAAPSFPTGTVRTIPQDKTTAAVPSDRPWQIGDPIVEPESVYRLPDGELVISRECSE